MSETASPKYNDIGSDAVAKATGRGWAEWFAVLDAAGAATMQHKEIARLLHEQYGCPGWWSQMVTVGYEQARGLREKHQDCDGVYQASGSKTVGVPVTALFAAWEDKDIRGRWLPDSGITIRKATPPKSMRITWVDGETSVELWFTAKGDARSQVGVQHRKLRDAAHVEEMRAYWAGALDALKRLLEAGTGG